MMPTHAEVEEFFACWSPIVRAAAGAEICAAIDAGSRAHRGEVTPWTDWTWADAQAEIEATSREAVNFANWIIGEPAVDPWEHANTRAHVEAVIERANWLIENGRIIPSKNK